MGRKHRRPMADIPEPLQHLELVQRQIVDAAGESFKQLNVHCPGWGRTVPMEECTACPRCEGVQVDATDSPSFLRCRTHSAAEQRTRSRSNDEGPQVGELMTRHPICVRQDVGLQKIVGLMLERGLSALPVVTDAGAPVGIVTKTDVIRCLVDRGELSLSGAMPADVPPTSGYQTVDPSDVPDAAQLMTPITITVDEEDSLVYAAGVLVDEGLHRLPVVGMDGGVVGILSTLDVTTHVAGVREKRGTRGSRQ